MKYKVEPFIFQNLFYLRRSLLLLLAVEYFIFSSTAKINDTSLTDMQCNRYVLVNNLVATMNHSCLGYRGSFGVVFVKVIRAIEVSLV